MLGLCQTTPATCPIRPQPDLHFSTGTRVAAVPPVVMSLTPPSTLPARSLTSGKAIAGILSEVSAKAAAQGLTREAVAARSAEHRHVPPHVPEATTGPEAYPLR